MRAGEPARIGVPLPRADAGPKAAGEPLYAGDTVPDGALWAGVRRAGVPRARLVSIDVGRAAALEGVVAALTHRDVAGTNRQGVIRRDQPVLVDGEVRHAGDPLALVVAESPEALERALALVDAVLEPLPPLLDAAEALRDGAPVLHPDHPGGNVLLEGRLVSGSGEAAETGCDSVVEVLFETPRQEHACLETAAGWAVATPDGAVEVTCSTQTPWRDRAETAEALGLDPARLRVVAPYLGGGFGSKDGITVQSLLALAALHSGHRPVRMRWGREESIVAGTKRHAGRMAVKLGATADGTLSFASADVLLDTGPYDHLGGAVLELALEHATGPYRVPNAVVTGRAVYTDNPIGGAFRGFGVTQGTAAVEQAVDLLADRLGLDRLEIRRKNALARGDVTGTGFTLLSSVGLGDALDALARHPLWTEREAWKAEAGPFRRRGAGIAALWHGAGYGPVVPDVANAKVELLPSGRFRVFCGVADMGQGNVATNAQVAGAVLCQPPEAVELVLPDTSVTLPSGSSAASRTTYGFANALAGASRTLRDRLLARAADVLMAREGEELALVPGAVRHLPTGRTFPLARLAGLMEASERTAVHRWRAPDAVDGKGASEGLRLHGFPHRVFSFGVHLALVEVDELTGAVAVCRYLAVTDCGSLLNPQLAEQQVEGAVAQGLGLALSEELVVAGGLVANASLSTYLVPTALDVPPIDTLFVPGHEETGPYGMKGVGEIAVNGPVPAVANALADACGVRLPRAPFTPERVLLALRDARKGIPR